MSVMETTAVRTPDYKKIKDVMTDTTSVNAISVHYKSDGADTTKRRFLWPLVLGTTTDEATVTEMVLVYQYRNDSDPSSIELPHPSPKNFRCFNVASLTDIQAIAFTSPPPPNDWKPPKLKFKKVQKQTCVEDPEYSR